MNIQRVERYIETARIIAQNMPRDRFRHISIITTHTGDLLAVGTNEKKTHPILNHYKYRGEELHSELAAYLGIRWYDKRRMVLINFRFNNRLEVRLSKPCKFCKKWITDIFEEIWYSNEFGKMEKL